MSGGAWGYLSHKLEESGDKLSNTIRFMADIEHELDWGVSGDSCEECAKLRVIAALYKFFEHDANYTDEVKELLTEHWSNEETMCPKDIEWKRANQ